MQLAIRRVLPTARQQLARPHRFGLPVTTHLRIRAQAQCFSHTCLSLRQLDGSSTPLEKPTEPSTSLDSTRDGVEEAAAPQPSHTPTKVADEVSSKEALPEETVGEVTGGNGEETGGEKAPRGRGRPAGTKTRRVVVKPRELPKPVIPDWFIQRSVRITEEHGLHDGHLRLGLYSPLLTLAADIAERAKVKSPEGTVTEGEIIPPFEKSPARYMLHESVWLEIEAHVRTGFLLPKGTFMDSLAATKTHCLLHLPKEGGVYFLDALAEKLAVEVNADLVRMDAQDFAEIAGDYLGDSRNHTSQSEISSRSIRSLGYDTQVTSPTREVSDEEVEEYAELTEEGNEEEEDYSSASTSPPQLIVPNAFSEVLRQLVRSGRIDSATILPSGDAFGLRAQPDHLNERKMATVLDAMISSAEIKRAAQALAQSPSSVSDSVGTRPVGKTIIHIRDYRELEQTTSGRALLEILHTVVRDRRREGERIVILGTTSAEEPISVYNKYGVRSLQTRSEDSLERPIVVPPSHERDDTELFRSDRDARIREINIRHLQDVIQRRGGEKSRTRLVVPNNWHLDPGEGDLASELSERVWTFDRVHRVATVVLGVRSGSTAQITLQGIEYAINTIEESDGVKFVWAAVEAQNLKQRIEDTQEPKSDDSKRKLVYQSQKDFTKHEKKLLAGVIDPKDIHTGFSSVHAAPETIEAMKTLTTLSIIRPEAFKYGVLATDRIPGVLLYGPPGTGKTLLAKAVAKETGATVLEVSGAQISDMYVGESEKNVQAIFSLAKRLSPCVVFIDEADAIFGTRQSLHSRSSHRETINQFLKEWADMTSTGFIMVATNRPFDLDDAVLRRLPRRILIDLPTPDDRLAILKIHLAAETLDPSVDLKNIADRTGLYSGSDLKNICVSAALACVKEEQAQFRKTGAYPERRILTNSHFETALNEISASISDDMGSLALIRKFDDKYGEKAGRKKRVSAWGFELGQTEAGRKGEGRVRMA